MKQAQEVKSFFYSQYFAEGIRITIGTLLPIIVCIFLDQLLIGTVISLGALVTGLSDTPGPPHHRRTGMLACICLCVFTIALTFLMNSSFILTCILIAVLSFVYSMFSVFNTRAATVGTMGIIILLMNLDTSHSLIDEIYSIFFVIIGSIWYMIISISFTQIQPYRQAQQELSESIRNVADFVRLKANFYNVNTDYDENYIKVVKKQVEVHEHQEKVRELLFQSKRNIKDTTKVGRLLSLIFNDIVDLFEQSMTTYYDYNAVRNIYSQTGFLHHVKYTLIKISHELDHIAYEINANRIPKPMHDFNIDIERLKGKVDHIGKTTSLSTIPLKKIIVSITKIVNLLNNVYSYSVVNASTIKKEEIDESNKFIQTSHLDWTSFKSNLSLDSSQFKHSLRLSITLTTTFIVLTLIGFSGHGVFWVLLTTLVIMKPGFGLTKERNIQRLLGTLIGGIIGGVILMTIHNEVILFVLMITFFLFAYSLFRVNYILAVFFLTPYVLILISFTDVNSLEMAKERILDTFIGSAIAFASSYLLFPFWESTKIKPTMREVLVANLEYLEQVAKAISNYPISITEYKLARKQLYIATANLGSTFQRLLTEPKWRQKKTQPFNSFVILNHIFSSYSASLFAELDKSDDTILTLEQYQLLKKTAQNLQKTIAYFSYDDPIPDWVSNFEYNPVNSNVEQTNTKAITDQLQFLLKISSDLQKPTEEILYIHKMKEIVNNTNNA